MTSFDELCREYETETIGEQIWELLLEITASVARRYPPGVYNQGEGWATGSYEELAQDVAVDLLLAENQIHYIFDIAPRRPQGRGTAATDRGLEDVRRLLVRQVKRALYRRRRLTVVDQLLARARRIASEPPFSIQEVGRQRWVTLADDPSPFRSLTDAELRPAVQAASGVPRLIASQRAERASMVYTSSALRELLELVVGELGGLSEGDLARIFEDLLTAWLPSSLGDGEGTEPLAAEAPGTADDRLAVSELGDTIRMFTSSLDNADATVLLGKTQGISDAALAQRLGRSRPWVADRKQALLDRLTNDLMSDVEEDLRDEAVRLLVDELSAGFEERES